MAPLGASGGACGTGTWGAVVRLCSVVRWRVRVWVPRALSSQLWLLHRVYTPRRFFYFLFKY